MGDAHEPGPELATPAVLVQTGERLHEGARGEFLGLGGTRCAVEEIAVDARGVRLVQRGEGGTVGRVDAFLLLLIRLEVAQPGARGGGGAGPSSVAPHPRGPLHARPSAAYGRHRSARDGRERAGSLAGRDFEGVEGAGEHRVVPD